MRPGAACTTMLVSHWDILEQCLLYSRNLPLRDMLCEAARVCTHVFVELGLLALSVPDASVAVAVTRYFHCVGHFFSFIVVTRRDVDSTTKT